MSLCLCPSCLFHFKYVSLSASPSSFSSHLAFCLLPNSLLLQLKVPVLHLLRVGGQKTITWGSLKYENRESFQQKNIFNFDNCSVDVNHWDILLLLLVKCLLISSKLAPFADVSFCENNSITWQAIFILCLD